MQFRKIWDVEFFLLQTLHFSPNLLLLLLSHFSRVQLCDPKAYPVHGILQARILEWVVFPFSRGSSQPRSQTQVSCIAGRFFTVYMRHEILQNYTNEEGQSWSKLGSKKKTLFWVLSPAFSEYFFITFPPSNKWPPCDSALLVMSLSPQARGFTPVLQSSACPIWWGWVPGGECVSQCVITSLE